MEHQTTRTGVIGGIAYYYYYYYSSLSHDYLVYSFPMIRTKLIFPTIHYDGVLTPTTTTTPSTITTTTATTTRDGHMKPWIMPVIVSPPGRRKTTGGGW